MIPWMPAVKHVWCCVVCVCAAVGVKMIVPSVFSVACEGGKPLSPILQSQWRQLSTRTMGSFDQIEALKTCGLLSPWQHPPTPRDNVGADSWRERLTKMESVPLSFRTLHFVLPHYFLAHARAKRRAPVSVFFYLLIMHTFQIPYRPSSIPSRVML